jgi:hypothetical protein
MRSAETPAGPRPGGLAQPSGEKRHARPALKRTQSARAVARWWQGVARDIEGATREVPGKEERARAHRNGVPTVRRCKRCRAAMINGGGIAPVVVNERGEVLQLEGDQRGEEAAVD